MNIKLTEIDILKLLPNIYPINGLYKTAKILDLDIRRLRKYLDRSILTYSIY